MRRTLIALAFSALCPAGGALAHHGSAEYDTTTVLRYEGVIVENRWMNPHSLTVLQTQSPSGKPMQLEIEGGGPSALGLVGVPCNLELAERYLKDLRISGKGEK